MKQTSGKFTKIIKLIMEGQKLNDKIKLIYILLRRYFGLKGQKELMLQNSDGTFKVRANDSDLWILTSLGDKEMRPYFNVDEGTFIDIGANVGKYSIILAKNPNIKVIAFEPDPYNLEALKFNIVLNNSPVVIKDIALSNKKGTASFFLNPDNQGNSSLLNSGQKGEEIFVKTDTLDNVLKDNKERISLIKIDVEGFEAEVLQGARETIRKFHPKIIFEAWNGEYLDRCMEVLNPLGYSTKKINGGNYLAKYIKN